MHDNVHKEVNHPVVDSFEKHYLFTLDLIYHRRQPRWAALISFLIPGFGGLGHLLIGQETKAGLLLAIEWFIVLPFGFFSKTLPYLLLFFHLLIAIDVWVLAGRVQGGQMLEKWEWLWNKRGG